MGFFDFLSQIARYGGFLSQIARYGGEDSRGVQRMNLRHRVILHPLLDEIAGARVLDLAAHDGRWAYAFAAAGAREVVGIEGRADLVAQFADFPQDASHTRVRMICDDLFTGLEDLAARGERFDIVGVLGIFYHVIEHFRLLRLVQALGPRLVIVDSEFALRPGAVILMSRERTDRQLNAIPQIAGQERAVIGIPSRPAMEGLADALGYDCEWLDWGQVPPGQRGPVGDYYREAEKRRGSCLLRPRQAVARDVGAAAER